jgi:DNA-binding Lrp family transcriptional regulator
MDEKDFRLLAAVHKDARQSYQSIARGVSLSAPSARDRLKRLESGGVLHGYGLWIDPSVFGLDEDLVFFKSPRTREEVLGVLASPSVAWIGWKLDGGLTVGVWSGDVDDAVDELAALLRERPTGTARTGRRDLPSLSRLDWAVIEALIDDPRIPFGDLTSRTGLSPKTVRKRLAALLESETLAIMPRQGASEGSGDLVYHLAVAGSISMGEVRKIIPDTILLHETATPPMKYLLCRSTDIGEVTINTGRLRNAPGIESATITLNRDLLFSTELEHSLVKKQVSRLTAAGSRPLKDGRKRVSTL